MTAARDLPWAPRPLRTFEDNQGLVLVEAIDRRWYDGSGTAHAVTGADDWPADAIAGVPLSGCVSGHGLAAWELRLIEADNGDSPDG